MNDLHFSPPLSPDYRESLPATGRDKLKNYNNK